METMKLEQLIQATSGLSKKENDTAEVFKR